MERTVRIEAGPGKGVEYRVHRAPTARGTILLLHGMASNLTRWSEFLRQTSVTASWDVIRMDLRGHGGSITRERIGMEVWCDDIDAVLEREGGGRTLIAGHCLGAQLALWYWRRQPHRVRGLILMEPLLAAALSWRSRTARAARPLIRGAIAGARALNRLGLRRSGFVRRDFERFDRDSRARGLGAFQSLGQVLRYMGPWFDLQTMPSANYLQDLIEVYRPAPDVAAIDIPVLVLISSGRLFSDPDATRQLFAPVPGARVETLAANHWILTEQPDQTRRLIEDWCGSLDRYAEQMADQIGHDRGRGPDQRHPERAP